MTRPQLLQSLMARAGERARLLPTPERYLWIAVWWHLHARETKNPSDCLQSADSQLRLFKDMVARPDHYHRRPSGKTDWEWSGLSRLPDVGRGAVELDEV